MSLKLHDESEPASAPVAENRALTRMLRSLAHDLESSGVQYCVLGGADDLASHPPETLFVAVHGQEITAFEGVLTMSPELRVIQMTSPAAGEFRFVVAYQGEQRVEFFPIHAMIDFRARGHIFFSADDLLEGSSVTDAFNTAAPEIELGWLLVKHCCEGVFPPHVAARLHKIAYDDNDGARNTATDIFGVDCGRKVVRRLLAADDAGLNSLCTEMREWLFYEVFKLDPLNQFWFWTDEIARAWQTWKNPAGFWVALHGAEGTGKSTVMRLLSQQMKTALTNTQNHHLRPQIFGGKRSHEGDAPDRGPRLGPILSLLNLTGFACDYILGYWTTVRPALVDSGLVLFKRYFDDLLADPRKYNFGASPWWLRWTRSIIPQPDLHILLEAPSDELLARKPQISKRELERQRDGYRDALDNRAVTIEASAAPETVAQDVVAIVLNQMELQYRKRRRKFINTPSTEFKRRKRYEFLEDEADDSRLRAA